MSTVLDQPTTDFAAIKQRQQATWASGNYAVIGRLRDCSLPAVYRGVVRSAAVQPGRDVLANARLFDTVAQAMDDAVIAVFDAKCACNLWRPVTAIRNGDVDGNEGTERDAAWTPLIDTPLHPEYPCARCILAATAATVQEAEAKERPLPTLRTASPTVQGVERKWSSLDALGQEVALARIGGGGYYRCSTETGVAMARQIGELAVANMRGTQF